MKLGAVLRHRCPKCGKGKFFTKPMSNIGQLLSMYEKCDNCSLKYEIEPGFFYGSMYVSYGLALIFSGITFAFFTIPQYFLHENLNSIFDAMGKVPIIPFIITNIVVLILLLPYIGRTARVLWLSLFIKK